MKDAVKFCSPWYNRLLTEEHEAGNAVKHLLNSKCFINRWSYAWCAPFISFASLSAAAFEMFPNRGEYKVLLKQLSCFLLRLQPREPSLCDSQHIGQIKQVVWLTGRQEIGSQNTINKHEAELRFKEGRLQSELNPPPHYWVQIVGDIKVASQTALLGTRRALP